jgi:hypothetical protein
MDVNHRLAQVGMAQQVLTGYSLEEVRGRRPWDFLIYLSVYFGGCALRWPVEPDF